MWETAMKAGASYLLPLAAGYMAAALRLNRRVRNLECDAAAGAEERKRVLRSLLACLYGLQEQGCDGPVTDGIRELESWLDERAHTLKSGE